MKLSILIPTHNRPLLFKRCLESVLEFLPADVEIIVNNDSADISEIHHPNVTYYYNRFDNLSEIYQFLLSKATGDYVYYLEDDDYLKRAFFEVDLDTDLIGGNYFPTYDTHEFMAIIKQCKDWCFTTADEFAHQINMEHLQLSQYIFKRSTIVDFEFPMDNNVHNDINLVMHSAYHATTIRTTSKFLFCQTIDGGDNVSFEGSSTQINITKSLDFLDNYEIFSPTSSGPRS